MDQFDSYLLEEPKALVGIIGSVDHEPDILQRLASSLDVAMTSVDSPEKMPSTFFKCLPDNHEFKDKKEPKEFPNTNGIIQQQWMKKHCELVPSVVLMVFPFSVDWSNTEWTRREVYMQEKFLRLKNSLSTREARAIMILFKIGSANYDKDGLDDRLSSLKRHLQLDSKTFIFMISSDLSPQSVAMKKLAKTIREFSVSYYNSNCKRLKGSEKSLSVNRGVWDVILAARYGFKIAFFCEILGQRAAALKHYKACFNALIESVDMLDENWTDQIKGLAECVNYKICFMLLHTSAVKDASVQLRTHIARFLKCPTKIKWRHNTWLANQYIIFAELLDHCGISENFAESDRSYYYITAAHYSKLRMQDFQLVNLMVLPSIALEKSVGVNFIDPALIAPAVEHNRIRDVAAKFKGMVLSAPKYIGSHPEIIKFDYSTSFPNEEEAELLFQMFYEQRECLIHHSEIIINLLNIALRHIPKTHTRRILHVQSLFVDILVDQQQHFIAYEYLAAFTDSCCSEEWIEPAIPLLKLRKQCAFLLGRLKDYLYVSLMLSKFSTHLVKFEREEIFMDVISILSSSSSTSGKRCAVSNMTGFGSLATDGYPMELCIPDKYRIVLDDPIQLFDTVVHFHQQVLEVGKAILVNISLTSKFFGSVSIEAMKIVFFGGEVVCHFIADKTRTGDTLGGCCYHDLNSCFGSVETPFQASLVFESNRPTTFTFPIFVPESYIKSFAADTLFGVESIELTMMTKTSDTTEDNESVKSVFFEIPVTRKVVIDALEVKSKAAAVKDFVHLFKMAPESLLLLTRPRSTLDMILPSIDGLSLLQGTLQRVNVVFSSGDNCILEGRCFLSSDYAVKQESDSFFWYPNIDPTSDEFTELATFSPLVLGSSLQPAQALIVPTYSSHSKFCIPLFVRSMHVGQYKLRLRLEYIPREGFSTAVSKEFEIKLSFHKALQVNFSITSHQDTQCGIRSGNVSSLPNGPMTIVAGDTLTLHSYFRCLESLENSIEIVDSNLVHLEEVMDSNSESESMVSNTDSLQHRYFAFANDSSSTVPLFFEMKSAHTELAQNHEIPRTIVRDSLASSVGIIKGETFVGNAEVQCCEYPATNEYFSKFMDQSSIYPRVSMGKAVISWRYKDLKFFRPYGTAGGPKDSSWIPLIARLGLEAHESPLVSHVSISTLSLLTIPVPSVQVIESPFEVKMELPTTSLLVSQVPMKFSIRSKFNSVERILVRCDLHQDVLITGPTKFSLEIGPQSSIEIVLSIVPLKCGNVPLPHIQLIWERSPNYIVAEVGSPSSMRYIYARPCGISLHHK